MIDTLENKAKGNFVHNDAAHQPAGGKSGRSTRRRRSRWPESSGSVTAQSLTGGAAWVDTGPGSVGPIEAKSGEPSHTDVAGLNVSRKETVLVVDSIPLMRGSIANALRKLGYRVLEASGALDVQRLATAHKDIRLLILDLSSVEISDLEFIAWFRLSHPTIKVVVAAGSLWELNFYHGIAREITLLAKPFTPAELSRIVRRVLA